MPVDLHEIRRLMRGAGKSDYELYLNTKELLSCQKDPGELANEDELQFQIVHQVEELWMKLAAHTLLDIRRLIEERRTTRVLTLFTRVHRLQRLMIAQLEVVETMSPFDYQTIRLQLGNGSGQESPGFQALLLLAPPLWEAFEKSYLAQAGLTLARIYGTEYDHGEAYVVAEALAEFDELFQKFLYHHVQLVQRSIGIGSKSLKGRPARVLEAGLRRKFFPPLWEVREKMTDAWGATYGHKRPGLRKG